MRAECTRRTILMIALLITWTLNMPARAAEPDAVTPPAQPATPPAANETVAKRGSVYPFQGTVVRVDKTTMTISLEGKEKPRLILVTSQSRLEKAGKPAVFDDATVGEKVTGQLTKNAEGKEEAVSLYIGPRPRAAPAKAAKTPAKADPPKPEER